MAVALPWDGKIQAIQYCRHEIDGFGKFTDLAAGGYIPAFRRLDDQRDMEAFIIKTNFPPKIMIAKLFPVIGGHNNQGFVILPLLFQGGDNAAEIVIRLGDQGLIGCPDLLSCLLIEINRTAFPFHEEGILRNRLVHQGQRRVLCPHVIRRPIADRQRHIGRLIEIMIFRRRNKGRMRPQKGQMMKKRV